MRRRPRALTISETMVSLTLLSLLLVGVLTIFPSSMSLVSSVRASRSARIMAQNKLETIAARPFHSLSMGASSPETVTLADGTELKLTTSVLAVPDLPLVKHIRCEVEWQYKTRRHKEARELYVHGLRR